MALACVSGEGPGGGPTGPGGGPDGPGGGPDGPGGGPMGAELVEKLVETCEGELDDTWCDGDEVGHAAGGGPAGPGGAALAET